MYLKNEVKLCRQRAETLLYYDFAVQVEIISNARGKTPPTGTAHGKFQ